MNSFLFGLAKESKARDYYYTAEFLRQVSANMWRDQRVTSITVDTCTGYVLRPQHTNEPGLAYWSLVEITKRDYLSGLAISSWVWSEFVTTEDFELKVIEGCVPPQEIVPNLQFGGPEC